MKKQVISFLFFLGLTMNVYSQYDSLRLSVLNLEKPDTNLLNIIDRHIYTMKKRGFFYTDDIVIEMYIVPRLHITQGIPKYIIDSIYRFNDFTNDTAIYPPGYYLDVFTEHKSLFIGKHLYDNDSTYKSLFYFKYKTLDVFIFSELAIKMPGNTISKKLLLKYNTQADLAYYEISNNYTIYRFFGCFNYLNEIISSRIYYDSNNMFDDYFEKSKIFKVRRGHNELNICDPKKVH